MGAEIVKVEERTEGDPLRNWAKGGYSAVFRSVNRGKRSIGLDVRTPAGREVMLRLLDQADVFIENSRPGVADRLRALVQAGRIGAFGASAYTSEDVRAALSVPGLALWEAPVSLFDRSLVPSGVVGTWASRVVALFPRSACPPPTRRSAPE